MAKQTYIGIGGVARKVKNQYFGVGGVARKVKKGYLGVNGVARQYFAGDTPLLELPVGTVIQLLESGSLVDYIIVHKGNPDTSLYANDCNGIWVLRVNCTEPHDWWANPYNGPYYNYSHAAYEWIPETFYPSLGAGVKAAIKTVHIPYIVGVNVKSLYNGLSSTAFLLSPWELGATETKEDGAVLSYFSTNTQSRRIADQVYWTRSWFDNNDHDDVRVITTSGTVASGRYTYVTKYHRPAMILNNSTILENLLI